MIGSVELSFEEIFTSVFNSENNETASQIIFNIRLPRVLLAIAVGGGLSIAGAVFQAILMNPLAEPYILGISSGGTFGAVLSFLLGLSFFGTQLFSFAGALMVIFLVFMLGKRFGELEPNVLLLTGVMVGAFFSASILLMMSLLQDNLRTAIFWLIGNLSLAKSGSVYYVLPITLIVSTLLVLNSQKYNVLALGADNARQLGINTTFVRNGTYILASLMIGSIVSVSGIVGFVGLLVPHVCRMIFGVDNRIVVPASFFIGAAYLTLADTLARTIISPAELPVGAVTAILGAPVFIYLLRKRFHLFF
jgi:iron complex transport system permease protein